MCPEGSSDAVRQLGYLPMVNVTPRQWHGHTGPMRMTTDEGADMRSAPTRWDEEYDLVVLGAGAGGMTAALVSAVQGLRTLLIEKSDQVGGTTARSSGTVWIPNNPEQRGLGITGDAEAAREYLDALVDGRADRALREAFIAAEIGRASGRERV